MIRFLADADLNVAIVSGCSRREPTMDFLSANDAGLDGVPDPEVLAIAAEQDRILAKREFDPEVLAIAAEQDRILVSRDFQTMPLHFGRFLQARGSSPGVFLVQQYSPVGVVIEELVLVDRKSTRLNS